MGAIQSTLTTALGAAQTIASTVGTVQALSNNNPSDSLALKQLQELQALQEAQSTQDAALAKQELALKAQQEASARKAALKKAVATQRAAYGGSGVSSSGGSAEAVLLGLYEDTATQQAESNASTSLNLQAIDQSLAQEKAINVLQASQLQEKQELTRLY